MVSRVKALLAGGGAQPRDIAILYRTTRTGAQLQAALAAAALPFNLHSSNLWKTKPVRDVLALSKGSIVELDRSSGEPADIYVNDRLIARGEIAHEDDRVAIRITELVAVSPAAGLA